MSANAPVRAAGLSRDPDGRINDCVDNRSESRDFRAPALTDVTGAIARVRAAASHTLASSRIEDAIARSVEVWRERNYSRRRDAITRIARQAGYSIPLLEQSLDALLKPFTPAALETLAAGLSAPETSRRVKQKRPVAIGFIMAGNVAGAGMHEVAIAFAAGAGVVIKAASTEPIFFESFARTLDEVDREVGARVAVLSWSRERGDLTASLIAGCDRVVAYGDDSTISSLRQHEQIFGEKIFGFGSRVSGATVAPSMLEPARIDAAAHSIARDVTLFEQLGCLSPHHVFVLGGGTESAREFAARIATELERLARAMPIAKIPLRDAAVISSVRENARWRRNAGEAIQLWEGPGWTVILDQSAASSFSISPGFRTVTVTGVRDFSELRERIAPAAGRIEAFAVAGDDVETAELSSVLREFGVCYISKPGEIQSPPLEWRHGGGGFFDSMVSR